LPLFAAAARDGAAPPEAAEPTVALRPMSPAREVAADYGHTGLSLRRHPVAFLRDRLKQRRIVPCAEAMASPDRRWLETAGLVLVRQRPGSAKGVMFITIEDETGIANLVVWEKVFEAHRRTVLGAGLVAVAGRIQREGEVVHLVVHRLTDLSRELAAARKSGTALAPGRGDAPRHGAPNPGPQDPAPGARPRDMYVRDLHLDGIRVKGRDFR